MQLFEGKIIEKGVFKDPYLLDFLELKDGYLENDLETAILKELELFILELGNGFTFVERQKRMIIDGDDHILDLLFYHRKLKRLVAIELKIVKFKAKHKGQMELYLKWLDKYEKQEGEQTPIGLILCAVVAPNLDGSLLNIKALQRFGCPNDEFRKRLDNILDKKTMGRFILSNDPQVKEFEGGVLAVPIGLFLM